MKILIMSDNHGRYELVHQLVMSLNDQVDYLIHCGDSEFASDDGIWSYFDGAVKGNMDFDGEYPNQQVISTPHGNIYVTHGHLLAVNASNMGVVEYAKQENAFLAFHGHTHRLYAEMKDGIFIANPGSLNHSRGDYPGTSYMIVEVTDRYINVEYFDESQQLIPTLTKHFER